MGELISLVFDEFLIHIIAHFNDSRFHLGHYIAFAYSFAYHRGWSAQLECLGSIREVIFANYKVWGRIETIRKFRDQCCNLEILAGFNLHNQKFKEDSGGHLCNLERSGA